MNCKGTIFRLDKLNWLQKEMPTDIDYARRLLLCKGEKFEPFDLSLSKEEWEKLAKHLQNPVASIAPVKVYDSKNNCVLKIWKRIELNK